MISQPGRRLRYQNGTLERIARKPVPISGRTGGWNGAAENAAACNLERSSNYAL